MQRHQQHIQHEAHRDHRDHCSDPLLHIHGLRSHHRFGAGSGYIIGLLGWWWFGELTSFRSIQLPYWITLAMFALHKVDENRSDFQDMVASITGTPVPEVTSPALVALLVVGVLPWLLLPFVFRKHPALLTYFAWTFFASMCFTEMAHFLVFPFLVKGAYTYFPAMATAAPLVVVAAWGIHRMMRSSRLPSPPKTTFG